jgi:uncharacterized protein YbjT (DUF2867 family)
MITIFGASGNTGGAAASYLLARGKKVRVVGRQRAKLEALVRAGAEACVGDAEKPDFVREALTGAEAAYLLIPPNPMSSDMRAYQTRVSDAMVAGVEACAVRHVVLLSSVGAQHEAGTGPIVALHAFEEKLKKLSALHALFLRPGPFMDNVLMNMGQIKAQGVYAASMPAATAVPMIASGDIGRYAGRRLEALDFSGKSVVHLNGPAAITQTELVTTLGQAVGKPIAYVQVTTADMQKGMLQAGLPDNVAALYAEMLQGASQGLLMPEPGQPVEAMSTTFATFAKEVFAKAYAA